MKTVRNHLIPCNRKYLNQTNDCKIYKVFTVVPSNDIFTIFSNCNPTLPFIIFSSYETNELSGSIKCKEFLD